MLNEQIIGQKLIKLDTVDSTNAEMARRLKEPTAIPEGLVIVAREQAEGKGLGENSWISEAGLNLLFSYFLRPGFLAAADQFSLNMAVSLGVYETVKLMFPDEAVKIKWPNDIYVGRRKLGGILISHAVSSNEILHSIIGIGINVNQTLFPETLPNPVSMRQLARHSFDLDRLLASMLRHLNNYYSLLENNHRDEIREAYKFALFGYFKWLRFRHNDRVLVARITGISPLGMLQLETDSNLKMECALKEISFIV